MKTIKFLAMLTILLGVCVVVPAQTRKPVKTPKGVAVPKKAPPTKATPAPPIKEERNRAVKPDFNQDDVSFLFFLLKNYPKLKDYLEFKTDATAYQCELRYDNKIVIDVVRDTSQTDPDGGKYNSGFIIDMSNLNVLLSFFSKNSGTVREMRLGGDSLYNYLRYEGYSLDPVGYGRYHENAENLRRKYSGIIAVNGLIPASQTPQGFVSLKEFFFALQRRYDLQKNSYDKAKETDAGSKSAADLLVWSQSERESAVKFVLSKMQPLFSDAPPLQYSYQERAWQQWKDKWEKGIDFENGRRSFKVTYGDYKRGSIEIEVKWRLYSGPSTGTYESHYKFNSDGTIERSFYKLNDKVERLEGIVRPSFAKKSPGDFISPDAALLLVKDYFGNR
ncbi:MAG: hypothetical protein M3X11_13475 [Acidobacteriota bacterium]|nr:hypothetical protein [Acidobacteriota bacterium]